MIVQETATLFAGRRGMEHGTGERPNVRRISSGPSIGSRTSAASKRPWKAIRASSTRRSARPSNSMGWTTRCGSRSIRSPAPRPSPSRRSSVPTAARSSSGGSTLPSANRRQALLASAEHAKTGQDANPRFLFELRVVENSWYLDAFVNGPGYNRALMFKDKLHPVGQWYHVAQTYDGKMFRSYVNGVLQAEAEIAFKPQGEGAASVGTRINRRNYFKGAFRQARFTAARADAGSISENQIMHDSRHSTALTLIAATLATLAARVCPRRSPTQQLLKPNPENWLHYSGSYNSHRHSPMKQITPDNVAKLQAKWAYHLVGQQHIQAVPIVADGVMYISQYNRVDALDARTGNIRSGNTSGRL